MCVCVGSRCAPATHIYLVPSLRFRICALHGPVAPDRRLSVFAQNFSYFRLFDPWTAIDRTTVPSTPLSSRSSTRAREFLWPRCRGIFSSRSLARVRIEHRSRGNETEREDACSKSRFGSVGALRRRRGEERRGEERWEKVSRWKIPQRLRLPLFGTGDNVVRGCRKVRHRAALDVIVRWPGASRRLVVPGARGRGEASRCCQNFADIRFAPVAAGSPPTERDLSLGRRPSSTCRVRFNPRGMKKRGRGVVA